VSWLLAGGILAIALLTVLFAFGLARAAAEGDGQLAARAAWAGADRRGGAADRRAAHRPWSHASTGRRQEDGARAPAEAPAPAAIAQQASAAAADEVAARKAASG
jgi:hypothetical protein